MSICNVEVVKMVGKYLNVPVGTVCYNTEKVLTTVLNKQSIEGFATIIMHLVAQSGVKMSQEQSLLCYQWLEHISMYGNQAAANPAFAKSFLQDINKALRMNTYLTGQALSVADVAAYHVLYPLLERLSILERESLLHLCRWSKHVQAQPKVCISRPPLPLNTLTLTLLAPAVH
ncbi:aaRS-interacting multifunctional protein 3 [Choristoneura fumiferana]|uniref:aaRS-interacting multifunctional protein 3 n=1 Tax=Choristoneura fumiferana TaxID=7141 RepID=UPI003D15609F